MTLETFGARRRNQGQPTEASVSRRGRLLYGLGRTVGTDDKAYEPMRTVHAVPLNHTFPLRQESNTN